MKLERTNYNGTLNVNDIGKDVVLIGWVAKKRNLGSIIFIKLRDCSGTIQVVIKNKKIDIHNEYIIQVYGKVAKKQNSNEIEVISNKINIINSAETTPIIIDDNTDALEEIRLKYRYLDLRRPILQKYLKIRSKIVKNIHEFLDENNFLEIETPILTLSTPEGARDYLVPSRIHHGHFYALPQSPQIYKQLLMIAGFERYYQIARCFRDEDLRSDRQPEFTQIDIETSFLNEDELLNLMEKLIAKIFKNTINIDIKLPLKKIKYQDAIEIYGSDKPDTRFEIKLVDLKEIIKNNNENNLSFLKEINHIKAIKISNIKLDEKIIKDIQLQAKKFYLEKYLLLQVIKNKIKFDNSFLDEKFSNKIISKTNANNNDIIIIAFNNNHRNVCFGLGALRNYFAKKLKLIKKNTYDLLWINDFPLFEKNKDGKITSSHHPFTRPKDEDLHFLNQNPLKVSAYAYDLVINGYEIGGGSLRIYDQKIQKKIFEILGLDNNDIQRKFGFFINALKYGTPPHAGIAFGLERLVMIICNTENIKDVIAFPKNLSAICPMSNSPSKIDQNQLDELGIKINE